MKKLKKKVSIGIILTFLIIGTITVKKFGLPPYYQTESAVTQLASNNLFQQKVIQVDGQPVHLSFIDTNKEKTILFFHGSPGQWTAWADYLNDAELQAQYNMIAADRLGFGKSDNGHHEESLEKQANTVVTAVKQQFPELNKVTIVGHSYGGPVALRAAIDHPDFIERMILLAPSIDPEYEDPRWYNKITNIGFIRNILPEAVDRSNQEIMPLKNELIKMKPHLSEITISTVVVHGKKDKLVPYQNLLYAKNEMVNSEVDTHLIENRGHFIPWEEYELVKKILLN